MATTVSKVSPCTSCNCSNCTCSCPTAPLTPPISTPSTDAEADYLYNGGAPGGENFDLERSIQGKGEQVQALAVSVAAGATSVSLVSATGLKAGQVLFFASTGATTFSLTGVTFEEAYVDDTYVAGSLSVPLKSALLFPHTAGDVVAYDTFSTPGPGLNAMLPDGLETVVPALYDPVTGLEYLQRAATTDLAASRNTQLAAVGLINGALGTSTDIDRARSQSDANTTAMATTPIKGVQMMNVPAGWSVSNEAAPTVIATTTKAAIVGSRHIVTSLSVSIAAGGTAQTPLVVQLLDGATPVWQGVLSAPVDGSASISQSGLAIAGTLGNAMTLAFAGATAATVISAVNMSGYDIG